MSTKEVAIKNEIVRIKGNVKAITVPKDMAQEILKPTELKILDKKYVALLPPLDNMEPNTIDIQGLTILVEQYLSFMLQGASNTKTPSPFSKMVINTTSGSPVQLNFSDSISNNSQGMLVLNQVFTSNDLMNIQYYFVGFDTTDSSYQGSSLELYVSATIATAGSPSSFTNLVRIAYSNLSISKTSDSYLFIVWLIEYQSIPYYLLMFIPLFVSNPGIYVYPPGGGSSTSFSTYAYNGSCNLACNGNCPSFTPHGYLVTTQDNTVIVQIPATVPVGGGVSSVQALVCGSAGVAIGSVQLTSFYSYQYGGFYNAYAVKATANYTFGSSYSISMALSPSGGAFYVFFATVTITYQAS